jgi:hypothetical protein
MDAFFLLLGRARPKKTAKSLLSDAVLAGPEGDTVAMRFVRRAGRRLRNLFAGNIFYGAALEIRIAYEKCFSRPGQSRKG